MRRTLWLCLVVGGYLALPSLGLAQVPQELRSAEVLVSGIEAAERSAALTAVNLELYPELETADEMLATIRDYLSRNPEDTFALILSVRLSRVRDMVALSINGDDSAAAMPEGLAFEAYHHVLDGVLARDSTVAAAHYWKARLLMEEADLALAHAELREQRSASPSQHPPAVQQAALGHLRQAIALDSDNLVYREDLALPLARADAFDAAAEALSHASTQGRPLHQLVHDLVAFGLPPGAVQDPALQSVARITLMMELGGDESLYDPADTLNTFLSLTQYLDLRIRFWITPASVGDVQTYYRARWPELSFATGSDGALTGLLMLVDGEWTAMPAQEESASLGRSDLAVVQLLPPELMTRFDQGREGPVATQRVGVVLKNLRRWPVADLGGPTSHSSAEAASEVRPLYDATERHDRGSELPKQPAARGAWLQVYDGLSEGQPSMWVDTTALRQDGFLARVKTVVVWPVCGNVSVPGCAPTSYFELRPSEQRFDCEKALWWSIIEKEWSSVEQFPAIQSALQYTCGVLRSR